MAKEITDEEILAQIPAARERARRAAQTEPRALDAHYDPETGRIVVELASGVAVAFPPSITERLAGATPSQLASVEIYPDGEALRWEALDEDLSVPGLVHHLFGSAAAREMGRSGGRTLTPARAAAARANGRKGGRPRKQTAHQAGVEP
jgi:hypothetical protein